MFKSLNEHSKLATLCTWWWQETEAPANPDMFGLGVSFQVLQMFWTLSGFACSAAWQHPNLMPASAEDVEEDEEDDTEKNQHDAQTMGGVQTEVKDRHI